jgi:hypothetical protein
MDGELAAKLYFSGLTTSEVGERLGISASTVRVQLKRAGVQMRKGGTHRPAGWSQYQRTSRSTVRTFHQWREILADALSRREAVSVRATVAEYLRRTPTKSEITAARRAAHRLVERGQASVLHVPCPASDSRSGGQYLILVRPGTNLSHHQLDILAAESIDVTLGRSRRFEPTAIAQDLAESVELLDRGGPSPTQRPVRPVHRAAANCFSRCLPGGWV